MSAANRGKWAEGEFRSECEARAVLSSFNFMRLPDAHAGSFQPTTADFLLGFQGTAHFVEIKEVAHEHRLPAKNLKAEQVARLRAWEMAGAQAHILVACMGLKPSPYRKTTAVLWRYAKPSEFLIEAPSWDLRLNTAMTLAQVMNMVLYGDWHGPGASRI